MPTEATRDRVQRLQAEGAQIVEVLSAEEFGREHIVGAINLPLDTLTPAAAEQHLRRDRPIVVYCQDVE